jgi:hypothetical protein
MKTRIHVNQHIIKANNKTGATDPPLTVKTGKTNTKCSRADIIIDGKIIASVVYKPEDPLACGARCWIETEYQVQTH